MADRLEGVGVVVPATGGRTGELDATPFCPFDACKVFGGVLEQPTSRAKVENKIAVTAKRD